MLSSSVSQPYCLFSQSNGPADSTGAVIFCVSNLLFILTDHQIDPQTVLVLPLYLDIQMVIGKGLRNRSHSDWIQYQKGLSDQVDSDLLRSTTGDKGKYLICFSDECLTSLC